MPASLRRSLTLVFMGLSVIPLLTFGFLISRQTYVVQESQSMETQKVAARYVAEMLQSFFSRLESELRVLTDVVRFQGLDRERKRVILSGLLVYQNAFEEIRLFDRSGTEDLFLSRQRHVATERPRGISFEELRVATSDWRTYFSPVDFDGMPGEPFLIMAIPLQDLHSGELTGILSTKVRLKALWRLIEDTRMGAGQDLFVVDPSDNVVAHRNPTVVLQGTRFRAPARDGIAMGLSGKRAVMAVDRVSIGLQEFRVVSEQTVSAAFALANQAMALALMLTAGMLAASFLLGVLIVRSVAAPIHAMATAAKAISAGDLSQRVSVSSHNEFGALADAFNSMAGQLQNLIGDLERRVAERTLQLSETNKELESFSYSVSHDLRSPLRAIDGFTRILVEDHSSSLNEEGRRVCGVIRENTAKMGRLIEELLAFSRLGHAAMNLAPLDMAGLVQEVFGEVLPVPEDGRIEVRVGPLPPAMGDRILVHQVWLNLVGNAVKFSSKRERAVVEVDGVREGTENAYRIRDNGAGFDMNYVDKLFRVFQRLHGEREFQGSGIGLAIVQRIVHRHGGRVWAEGEPDKGATFHFTLPGVKDG